MKKEDLILLEGVKLLLAIDTARMCVAIVVEKAERDPSEFLKEAQNAMIAMIEAGNELIAFKDFVISEYAKGAKAVA